MYRDSLKKLRRWVSANSAALRLCARMTVAGLLAYLLAELFALPQGYWAVFSAIIIMQASVGGSVKATLDRLIGTVGGAVAGGVVAFFMPHDDPVSLGVGLVVALAPLTLVAALRPKYRIAPLTAAIVLLTPGAQELGPLASAYNRILEISLGSIVGLGVALLLMPARAHGLVINAAARMLGLLADLLHDWLAVLGGNANRARIVQLQDDIRAGMARLEIAAGEARHERRTYLTREFDPDPLVRTVFRLRNDLIIIGRAAAEPLPDEIITPLRDPLAQVSERRNATCERPVKHCYGVAMLRHLPTSNARSRTLSRRSRCFAARARHARFQPTALAACLRLDLRWNSYAATSRTLVTA